MAVGIVLRHRINHPNAPTPGANGWRSSPTRSSVAASARSTARTIYMSTATDPYQQGIEARTKLTRGLLQVLADRHAPKLVVQTRGPLVTRDIDLFHRIEEQGGRVRVNMTVTTDDEAVRRIFEPTCPSNDRRIEAVAELHAAGVDTCITMTPLLWVDDPGSFADTLLATGCQRFVAQPFHFAEGAFVARTGEGALDLMAERLGCTRSDVRARHLSHYRAVTASLRETLPDLGEGERGFAPPF